MAAVPLVHNPAAGGGRGRARLQEALRALQAAGLDADPVATEGPGHATILARRLAEEGHKTIYILGGDGTFSEAANGVMPLPKRRRPAFGLLPAGTGNDFLRDFAVHDLDEAVRRIARGRRHEVDVAEYEDGAGTVRWSVNIFGTGFAAEAADLTNRRLKWLGPRAYDVAVVLRLMALRPTPTRLVLDGAAHDGDYPLVMVCNTVHTGGAMRMAPDARPDDGWLDVVTAEGVGRRELLRLLVRVRDGSHIQHPRVHVARARRIEIAPERDGPLLADGEVVGTTPARVQVRAKALRVLL